MAPSPYLISTPSPFPAATTNESDVREGHSRPPPPHSPLIRGTVFPPMFRGSRFSQRSQVTHPVIFLGGKIKGRELHRFRRALSPRLIQIPNDMLPLSRAPRIPPPPSRAFRLQQGLSSDQMRIRSFFFFASLSGFRLATEIRRESLLLGLFCGYS